ncbi:ABC transporter ATP-binding protein [Spirosoma soli]|uniref:ABC transporter ATP-binding protein n=1 Tax=Spirosoma soli TaxID=1770529 RepID=A0ABW5MCN2_9BACT
MSDIAIQVDNVSKRYLLGTTGTGSFRHDLHQWWNMKVLKKADPFQYPDEPSSQLVDQSYIWALKQVNFQAKQGEVWGLIGGNGSGKSTLLKIISRIIRPTQGTVRGRGRLSSLLEVGAGFHEDLTGRENIYLSGYILGMKRQEIKRRFDEIIDFSGVAQFIDTPVKRYSSGMYVRLAFAVAAHLDADIMIVDEVLAVGDAEFQKKCLGKMHDFARQDGRTILFVSHNLQAVEQLCQHGLWLQRGQVMATGPIQLITNQYTNQAQANHLRQAWVNQKEAPGNDIIRIKSVELLPQLDEFDMVIDVRTPLTIKFEFWVMQDDLNLLTGLHLFAFSGEAVLDVMSSFTAVEKGLVAGECTIPGNLLNDGSYYLSLIVYRNNWDELYYYQECLTFDVEDYRESHMNFSGKWMGAIRPKLPVKLTQVTEDKGVSIIRPV